MLEFHALKVSSIESIADDAVCVTLDLSPAQKSAFAFHAGQYVTVRRTIGEREERRTYSIVTPPGAGGLKLGIRIQSGGRVSGDIARSEERRVGIAGRAGW